MKKIIVCLLVLMGLLTGSAWADLLIIAYKNAPDSELTQKDVQKMFLGKLRQWSDHSKVWPAVAKDSSIREVFLHQYLRTNEGAYSTYWKRMIFTGEGLPPKSFETETELLDYVSKTDGSIACISSENVPVNGNSEVKIIKIK